MHTSITSCDECADTEHQPIRARWLKRYGRAAIAPAQAVAELIAAIFSPGLDGVATLPSIDISNGGQHRY